MPTASAVVFPVLPNPMPEPSPAALAMPEAAVATFGIFKATRSSACAGNARPVTGPATSAATANVLYRLFIGNLPRALHASDLGSSRLIGARKPLPIASLRRLFSEQAPPARCRSAGPADD